jgi:hypothetical protein
MSDSSDRNIVIVIFIIAFIYINYIRIKIDIASNWENMKCNPMNLLTSSYFRDPVLANNMFHNCINNLSANAIEQGLQTAYKKQADAINSISNQEAVLKGYLDVINNNVTEVQEKLDSNNLELDDIRNRQDTFNRINTELATTDPTTNKLYNFTTSINNIFNNIKTILPSFNLYR